MVFNGLDYKILDIGLKVQPIDAYLINSNRYATMQMHLQVATLLNIFKQNTSPQAYRADFEAVIVPITHVSKGLAK